ncbi:hypothetical protein Z948_233 [Sulfitobacter donghicola DSW-25 = KCTC 12864 = JCM 14565]|nr:hypothetical protein Z948_233 [Sulfitobacter donghicola DSW-25 = KCTC 12864 = JCM 14565]
MLWQKTALTLPFRQQFSKFVTQSLIDTPNGAILAEINLSGGDQHG